MIWSLSAATSAAEPMPARIDPALIPLAPNVSFESSLWEEQVHLVAGLDEAGRGAWAGPVSAAAVILPPTSPFFPEFSKIRDSKQLSPGQRYALVPIIKQMALSWGIGFASSIEIDEMGILPATKLAMTRALNNLSLPPQHLLIDALFLPEIPIPQTALIKGDQRSLSIAAASILAKTSRDEWMIDLESREPGYCFASNKGYGTRSHQRALSGMGPGPHHRMTYAPVKRCIKN